MAVRKHLLLEETPRITMNEIVNLFRHSNRGTRCPTLAVLILILAHGGSTPEINEALNYLADSSPEQHSSWHRHCRAILMAWRKRIVHVSKIATNGKRRLCGPSFHPIEGCVTTLQAGFNFSST
jgi:hypothetical protein